MSKGILVCLVALGTLVGDYQGQLPPKYKDLFGVCLEVADAAVREGVSVYLAVAVSREESAFQYVSRGRAKGPLQIIPAYHCPDRDGVVRRSSNRGVLTDCELVTEGVRTVRYFLREYLSTSEALCHYNSGTKCLPGGRQYSKRVLRRARVYRELVSELVSEGVTNDREYRGGRGIRPK